MRELLINCKVSDRKIAEKLGISQPTVTRTRSALEKSGAIKGYVAITDLAYLGYEIIAFSTLPKPKDAMKLLRLSQQLQLTAQVVYAVESVKYIIVISVHKNYTDYTRFSGQYSNIASTFVVTATEPTKTLNIPIPE